MLANFEIMEILFKFQLSYFRIFDFAHVWLRRNFTLCIPTIMHVFHTASIVIIRYKIQWKKQILHNIQSILASIAQIATASTKNKIEPFQINALYLPIIKQTVVFIMSMFFVRAFIPFNCWLSLSPCVSFCVCVCLVSTLFHLIE